jgi:hypothetical protein
MGEDEQRIIRGLLMVMPCQCGDASLEPPCSHCRRPEVIEAKAVCGISGSMWEQRQKMKAAGK